MENLRIHEKFLPDIDRQSLSQQRENNIVSIIEGLKACEECLDSGQLTTEFAPLLHRFLDVFKITDEEVNCIIPLLYRALGTMSLRLDQLSQVLSLLKRLFFLKRELTLELD